MAILAKELTETVLVELIGQSESQTLEFKQTLPGSKDKDGGEFLKDICAFANADGGDIVFGLAEAAGKASKAFPIADGNSDAAIRRLGQMIDSGIEPRLVGLQLVEVPAAAGGYFLVARVPASFNGPHRYLHKGVGKFVMRNGKYIAELSYGQLKSAFDRTATLGERARKFRENRVEIIRQRKTWRPLVGGPMCAVHFVPITAMAGNAGVDIAALYNDYHDFMLAGWRSGSRTTNLDGLVVHPVGDHGSTPGYTQVFRTGAFEAARAGGGLIDPSQNTIPSTTVSNFYRDAVGRFLGASRKLGFSGPAIVGIALLEVAGHQWAYRNDFQQTARADRNDLVLPEVWVEQLDATNNVDEIARPLLQILWQAFGIEECLLYDKNGIWTPR